MDFYKRDAIKITEKQKVNWMILKSNRYEVFFHWLDNNPNLTAKLKSSKLLS